MFEGAKILNFTLHHIISAKGVTAAKVRGRKSKAFSKAVQIGAPREIVDAAIDIIAEYEAVHGVPNTAAPKVFMKYFFMNPRPARGQAK